MDYREWINGCGCNCNDTDPIRCSAHTEECECSNILAELDRLSINDEILEDRIDELSGKTSGGTSGITSGEVQVMIDESIEGKLDITVFNSYSANTNTILNNKLDASAFTPSDYYKKNETSGKTEIENALADKQDKLSAGTNIIISGNVISAIGGSASGVTSGDVQIMIDNSISGKVDVSTFNIYSGNVNNILANKMDLSAYTVDSALSLTSTNPVANSAVTEALNDKLDASAYTPVSLSGYATEQWVLDKHYISGVDLSDYAKLEDIPTSNSAFTNDMHYLTSADTVNYITSANVKTQIDQSISGKVDTSAFTEDERVWSEALNDINDRINIISGDSITSGEVQTMITKSISGKANTEDVVTNVEFKYEPGVVSAYDRNLDEFGWVYTKAGVSNGLGICVGNGLVVDNITFDDEPILNVDTASTVTSASTAIPTSQAVYNFVNNNYMSKNQIWCGDETAWTLISGSTDPDIIYFIY